MAFETGNATSHTDLYAKLLSFLTSNADLVSSQQAWEVVWQAPSGAPNMTDRVLRGPGLSTQDQVYVGLRLFENFVADNFWIEAVGMTGILPGVNRFDHHISVTPKKVRIFADVGPMTYWFVANGRRIIVVVKISTIFQSLYAGLFLPYGTPVSYPYPLFVGGSAGELTSQGGPVSWRSTDVNHRHFVTPHQNASSSATRNPGAWLLDAAGQWLTVASGAVGDAGQASVAPEWGFSAFGFAPNNSSKFGEDFIRERMTTCFGGEYAINPIHLVQASPVNQTFGILDGAFRCQGNANSSENIITLGGADHLVVQNVFRTGIGHYWALALE